MFDSKTQMSETITIRTCTLEDVNTLVALGIKTFRDTFEMVNTPENMRLYLATTFTHQKLAEEFNEPGCIFFVAESDDVPVGYAKVRTSQEPSAYVGENALEIERIYAVKDQIGKGVGRAMMQTCLEHGRKNGYQVVWLGVWEHNATAIAFYEKWGFEKFSEHVFMLGHDAQTDVMMKKKLE